MFYPVMETPISFPIKNATAAAAHCFVLFFEFGKFFAGDTAFRLQQRLQYFHMISLRAGDGGLTLVFGRDGCVGDAFFGFQQHAEQIVVAEHFTHPIECASTP
ncbi:MAG: hypothetical protein KF734_17495 [Saprospiraceae bacterium]|nr:hypothetical protein [Saprospiraceae bacterium]